MPNISTQSLVLLVQLVDREIEQVEAMPEAEVTADDQVYHYDLGRAEDDLADAYAEAAREASNLPAYSDLVRRRRS